MAISSDQHVQAREKALAEGLTAVASELRLVDVIEYISYIRFEQFGNINNLVGSATELYFKSGAVRFAHFGDVDLDWGRAPAIRLEMEFHHPAVDASFRLILHDASAQVELTNVTFKENLGDPFKNTDLLIRSIKDVQRSGDVPSGAGYVPAWEVEPSVSGSHTLDIGA